MLNYTIDNFLFTQQIFCTYLVPPFNFWLNLWKRAMSAAKYIGAGDSGLCLSPSFFKELFLLPWVWLKFNAPQVLDLGSLDLLFVRVWELLGRYLTPPLGPLLYIALALFWLPFEDFLGFDGFREFPLLPKYKNMFRNWHKIHFNYLSPYSGLKSLWWSLIYACLLLVS